MIKNVLDYVQATLSVMDSDLVDTIGDTEESSQIAHLLQDVYEELMAREEWAHLHGPLTLTAAADVTKPATFTLPADIKYVTSLSYNTSETGAYRKGDLCYLEPQVFLNRYSTGEGQANKLLVSVGTNLQYYCGLDNWPTHWTSFDDLTVVMNSVHKGYDSTLTADKLQGWGVTLAPFQVTDEFVPDLPRHMVPLLQAELNRQAFQYFKQIESKTDEQKAARQLARHRRENSRLTRPADQWYRNRFGRHG